MITITDYFMGRRELYPMSVTPDLEREAIRTVELANKLIVQAESYGVKFHTNPTTGSYVSSGWRPATVNASTPNAAPNSKHMTGQAVDIYDPDGDLDDWLMSGIGQATLNALGLWMEHPSATKTWSHIQTIPPRSGNRVFYP